MKEGYYMKGRKQYKYIINNNLVRFLVSRNYFYIHRFKDKEKNKYICCFANSPLLRELLDIYYKERKQGLHNSYVEKDNQKAE